MSSTPSTNELVILGAPIALRDGSRIRIRQGHRADRGLLLRGFQRLSPQSRYRRFLAPMPELSKSMVRYLTEIDHHDHEAMIAVDERTGEGIGVARYVRDPDRPEVAELAVTVIDDWQRRGVGTLLLEVISARAREEGITTFTALMLAANEEMLDLLKELDPLRIIDRETGRVEIEVPIPPIGLSPALRKLIRIAARHGVTVPLADRRTPPRVAEGPASSSAEKTSRRRVRLALLAGRVVESLGGRYSVELGIDLDRNGDEIERWALAATLFGARISAKVAGRTFAVLEQAGVHSIADAGHQPIDRLIALLDAGGYARYDLRTAERLQAIARSLEAGWDGRVSSGLDLPPHQLRTALGSLPGWGPVTVRLFLRELRGVRATIDPPLDAHAARAAEHLGLPSRGRRADLTLLRGLAVDAHIDIRDLEAALVRLSLAHGRHMPDCPGRQRCTLLARPA